jgi:hypothetical protein
LNGIPGSHGFLRNLSECNVGLADLIGREANVWGYFCWRFGPKLGQKELISIGELVAVTLRIKLDWDARLCKSVIIK